MTKMLSFSNGDDMIFFTKNMTCNSEKDAIGRAEKNAAINCIRDKKNATDITTEKNAICNKEKECDL